MTMSVPGVFSRAATRRPAPAPLASWKFALPKAPGALVPSASLTDRLITGDGAAIVSIVAPAGYGKTTLLRQWADRLPDEAYVALDVGDNDPVVLLQYLATALDRVEPLDPNLWRLLASPGASLEGTLLPGFLEAIWARRTPTVLMLDDVHLLNEPTALLVVSSLMLHLPTSLRLALAARRSVPFPFARLRVSGDLLELSTEDLALDAASVSVMAAAMGAVISPDQIAMLVDRTEGWPAATYLELRSVGSRRAVDQAGLEIRGTDAWIAEYMRSELIEPLDAETQRWLLRSSALETMNGPLCDAAIGTSGSLTRLRQLERQNLFVIALDGQHATYRYHRLLQDLLRDELDAREPGAAAEVASRAATWCAEHGEPERAVEYAHASGDMALVARLVGSYALPLHWSGRTATLSRWLDWFDRDDERERHPALALLAGWVSAMDGRTREARRWLGTAQRSSYGGPMPDGATKASWLALLRGFMAPAGADALMTDARTGLAGIPDDSPFRQTALILAGFADIVADSPESADRVLAEAAELSEARRATPGLALALGERASIAFARGDVTAASGHVERGLALVRDAGMEDYVASGLLHAVAARVAVARGSAAEARLAVARVHRMRPRLSGALPVLGLQMRLETIHAYLVLREAAAARTLLLEVKDILRQCPDMGTLGDEATKLERAVESMRSSAAGAWTLTAAELRLLAYLPTHLSFREIAERLFVSPHTIKSQATAIYGKLGVSSRRGAIEQAVEASLLDASVIRIPDTANDRSD